MELLLILIYVSLCYAVFKVFRIPVGERNPDLLCEWVLADTRRPQVLALS